MSIKSKIINYRNNRGLYKYVNMRRHKRIKKNYVLLESMHGGAVSGQIYYLIPEIQDILRNSKIFIVSQNPEEDAQFLKKRGLSHFKIVKHMSLQYFELLATAQYLINDTTFYPFFNKREGQQYFIIWHGTPLKKMGKDTAHIFDLANVQRNFYMADQVIVSNDYSKEIMAEAYNLNHVYNGDMVVGPMPRNSVFYEKQLRERIRRDLDIEDKKVLCYMPTWRGQIGNVSDARQLETMLLYLNQYLDADTVLYVKLHHLVKRQLKMNYSNIKFVPDTYEIYEFLTATEGLITDYSSVMFDYLNMDKPIILYLYDLTEYQRERGLYQSPSDYPFTTAYTLSELAESITNLNSEAHYTDIKDKMVPYDNRQGAREIAQLMINGSTTKNIKSYRLEDKNTIIAVHLDSNNVEEVLGKMQSLESTSAQFILYFDRETISVEQFPQLMSMPDNVTFYPTLGNMNGNFLDRLVMKKLQLKKVMKNKVRRLKHEEEGRLFGDVAIDCFVTYVTSENSSLLPAVNDRGKTAVWLSAHLSQVQSKAMLNKMDLSKINYIITDNQDLANHFSKTAQPQFMTESEFLRQF
ncbi:CDP-glycerol glycerophosphotransferase family protein [Staphylococcus pettenkoferi]